MSTKQPAVAVVSPSIQRSPLLRPQLVRSCPSGVPCSKSFEQVSLTKLMVSHDLVCPTVTNQIAFDQRDSNLIPKFERMMGRGSQVLVSELETVDTITFT